MLEKPHVNLIIATPGHSMMSSYVKCLLDTINKLQQDGITVLWTSEYSSHVADAREITLNGSNHNNILDSSPLRGQFTYDKILWIDSDINWKYEDVKKLYESDKDIVTGAYMLATGEVMAYKEILRAPYSYEEIKNKTELEKIEACGFGFICVKQGVFEKLSRPWFQSIEKTIKVQDEGEKEKDFTFSIIGEDIAWCERVGRLGFEIWLDPSVKVTHHKIMKLTWEGIKP
jgi:hypothetical protein